MATFLNKESNQKKLSSREDHYRKAHALYVSVSNDYEDARLRMIEYEYAPNAVEQVMEVHSKIVAAKKGRMDDAKEDLNRCVDRYNNLCDDLKSPQGADDVTSKDGYETTSNNDSASASEDDGSKGENGGDSDVSLVNEGEDKDITDIPTKKVIGDAADEMEIHD